MALIPNKKEEEQEGSTLNELGEQQAPAQGQQSTTASGAQVAGSSSSVGSGASVQQDPNKPKAGVGSGTFTPVQKYIQANKKGAKNIAGAVTQKAQTQAETVGQQVQKQRSDFMNRVARNRARMQQAQTQAQSAIERASTATADQEVDPNQVQNFRQFFTGAETYTKPGQLDITRQQIDANRLQNKAEQVQGGAPGEYLRDTFGREGYSRGAGALDELVLAGDSGARQDIADRTQAAAAQARDSVFGARREAVKSLGQLGADEYNIRQGLETQLSGERSGLESEVMSRAEELEQQRAALKAATESGEYSPEALAILERIGLGKGSRTYGVNLDDLVRAQEIGASHAASRDELARARALASLAGTEQSLIADETQVGQDVSDLLGLSSIQERVRQAEQEYQGRYDPLRKELGDATVLADVLNKFRHNTGGQGYYDYKTPLVQALNEKISEATSDIDRQINDIENRNYEGYISSSNRRKMIENLTAQKQQITDRLRKETPIESRGQFYNRSRNEAIEALRKAGIDPLEYARRAGGSFGWDFHGAYVARNKAEAEKRAKREAIAKLEKQFKGKI